MDTQQFNPGESSLIPSSRKNKNITKIFIILGFFTILAAVGITIFLWTSNSKQSQSSPHYIGSQTITLKDVHKGSLSGFCKRTYSVSSVSHTISAELPELIGDEGYYVWVGNSRDKEYIRLGKLNKESPGRYSLFTEYFFLEPDQYFGFNDLDNIIMIFRESYGFYLHNTKILEGKFTK